MSSTEPRTVRPRLLVVAPSAYPFGGVAVWLDGLVAGLRERGWPVAVALLAGAHHDVDRYLARHPLGDVIRIANPSGSRAGRQRALARAIAASGAEVVLAVNVGDVEEAVDRLRRAGGPAPRLVTTQHALQADFYAHLRVRAAAVDGVIVTNRLGVELARAAAGLEPERIAYAPYGVDAAAPAPAREGSGPLRIVWAGRLERRQKRVGDLPAICAALTARGVAFRLELAGDGPDRAEVLQALAAREGAGEVRWLGEVARERLRAEVYNRADVLLVTSEWETGPIVAWEALVAGLAVVSSRYLGSGREAALRDGETALLFPVGGAAAAAAALVRAADGELRRRLVAAGQAEVLARYSTSASLEAWESALARLTAQPPRSPLAAPPALPVAGRLDRWLGPEAAELLRTALGVRRRQASPGDEWPHALERGDAAEFTRLAAALDRPPAAAAEASA